MCPSINIHGLFRRRFNVYRNEAGLHQLLNRVNSTVIHEILDRIIEFFFNRSGLVFDPLLFRSFIFKFFALGFGLSLFLRNGILVIDGQVLLKKAWREQAWLGFKILSDYFQSNLLSFIFAGDQIVLSAVSRELTRVPPIRVAALREIQ